MALSRASARYHSVPHLKAAVKRSTVAWWISLFIAEKLGHAYPTLTDAYRPKHLITGAYLASTAPTDGQQSCESTHHAWILISWPSSDEMTESVKLLAWENLTDCWTDLRSFDFVVNKKGKGRPYCIAVNGTYGTISWHSYTECHLPYGITQCYLLPDTSEHTPP